MYCDSHLFRFKEAIYKHIVGSDHEIVSKEKFKEEVFNCADRCVVNECKGTYRIADKVTTWFHKYGKVLGIEYKEEGDIIYVMRKED